MRFESLRVEESTTAEFAFRIPDGLAWENARRRGQRDTNDKRKESGRLHLCGLCAHWHTHCMRRDQNKRRASQDRACSGVTGSHRRIVPGGVAVRISIALIRLLFLCLRVV